MKLAVKMRVLLLCISTLLVPTLLGHSGGSGIAAATSTSEPEKSTTTTPASTTTQASTGAGKNASTATASQAQTTSLPPSSPTTTPSPESSTDSVQSTTESVPTLTTVNASGTSTSAKPQSTSTVPPTTTSSPTTTHTSGSTSTPTTATSPGTTSSSTPTTSSNANATSSSTATTGSQTVTSGPTTVKGSSTSTPTTQTSPTTGSSASTASTSPTTTKNVSTTASSSSTSSASAPISTSTPAGNESSSETPSTTPTSPTLSTASSGATIKPTSTAAPTTTATPPPRPTLLINEVNLIFNETAASKFVEIKGPANFSANVTVVIFNGITGSVVFREDVNVTLSTAGLHKIDFQGLVFNETTYAVAVFHNDEDSNSSLPLLDRLGKDLSDSFIFSTTNAQLNGSLQEIMLPENQNLFVIKQGGLPPGNHSISRCGGESAKDQGAFMVTPATPGTASDCSRQPGSLVQVKLLKADCNRWHGDKKLVTELLSYMVATMNGACQCGVSRMLFTNYTITCGSVIFEAMLAAAFPNQSALVIQTFKDTVANSSRNITVGNKSYEVDACSANNSCHILKPIAPPSTEKEGDNIKVTVTVVVSCIVLFIIIVIAVVFYMKRKRKGILQFRMTRLDEDDDLIGDMDDFVGGGGEPSFSNPLYGRRK